jgi:hypothetical protein
MSSVARNSYQNFNSTSRWAPGNSSWQYNRAVTAADRGVSGASISSRLVLESCS